MLFMIHYFVNEKKNKWGNVMYNDALKMLGINLFSIL